MRSENSETNKRRTAAPAERAARPAARRSTAKTAHTAKTGHRGETAHGVKATRSAASKRKAAPKKRKAATTPSGRQKSRARKNRLIFALAMLVVIAAGVLFTLNTFFNIKYIEVTGSEVYTDEELIAASGIRVDDNLFRIHAGETARRLEYQFPYAEKVKLKRHLPSTLEIRVTEAVPWFSVNTEERSILLSTTEKILEIEEGDADLGAVRVYGLVPTVDTLSETMAYEDEVPHEIAM